MMLHGIGHDWLITPQATDHEKGGCWLLFFLGNQPRCNTWSRLHHLLTFLLPHHGSARNGSMWVGGILDRKKGEG